MTTTQNISGYHYGETLEISAQLTRDGAALTSGTVMLRLSLARGAAEPAAFAAAMTHDGAGLWTVDVAPGDLTFAAPGQFIQFEIWETDSDVLLILGNIYVGPSIGTVPA